MTGGALVLFAAGWLGHWLWARRYDWGTWLRDPDPLPSDREPMPMLRSVRIVRRDEGE
jgi:hypothetical protein